MIKGCNHKHQLSMLTRTNKGREVDYLRCVMCKAQWEMTQPILDAMTVNSNAPAMLAALRAVEEAFSYVAPSALPSDAAVDWQAVADQVDIAIYHAVNIGVAEEATQ